MGLLSIPERLSACMIFISSVYNLTRSPGAALGVVKDTVRTLSGRGAEESGDVAEVLVVRGVVALGGGSEVLG